MNSYTDKDLNRIAILSILGFCIAFALFLTVIPELIEQSDTINQVENRVKILENTCQKS